MSSLEICAWVFSLLLVVAFLYCATYNAVVVWRTGVLKQDGPSYIPILGGMLGFFGMRLLPIDGARSLAWAVVLLDMGCVMPLVMVPSMLLELLGWSGFRLECEFKFTDAAGRNVSLRLYKGHRFDVVTTWRDKPSDSMIDPAGRWEFEGGVMRLIDSSKSDQPITLRLTEDESLEWVSGPPQKSLSALTLQPVK